MTAGTDTRPTSAPPAAPSRLGPFEILGRLAGLGTTGQVALSVKGCAGTSLAGVEGVAQCVSASSDPAERAQLAARLAALSALSHPAIATPVHAALSGDIAYVVNQPLPVPADPTPPSATVVTPYEAANDLLPISAALETAHRVGLSHGDLSRATVVVGDDGPIIGGWPVIGRGAGEDQRGLALLAIDWLVGSPFVEDDAAAGGAAGRHERLRRHLDQVTDRLVFVLGHGSATTPEDRYPSVTDFVAAFNEAVTRSAEELVQGGFEAISARTPQIARFLAGSAERYDPYTPGLDLLTLQLSAPAAPGEPFGVPSDPAGGPSLVSPTLLAASPAGIMAGLDPALTAGIPAEMLALIAPPIPATTKPRNNPWLVMMLGVAGLTLLGLIGAAIILFAGSS